jgi:hypothetical protein
MTSTLKRQTQPAANPGPADDKSRPDTWWKWILIYPTLAISIVSSIPTYIELAGSRSLGVPFGQHKAALRENELWKENIACAAAPFDGLANKQNIQVDAVVCRSGNVLVRVKPPEQKTAYKWVPLDSVAPGKIALNIVPAAHAQSAAAPIIVAQSNFRVLCQNWVANGLIRRRIHDTQRNQCFDEVVNTFSGQVVRANPAPCSC